MTSFTQVNDHVEVQAGAFCKTVGFAHVSSNPSAATHFRSSRLSGTGRCHNLSGRGRAVPQTVDEGQP